MSFCELASAKLGEIRGKDMLSLTPASIHQALKNTSMTYQIPVAGKTVVIDSGEMPSSDDAPASSSAGSEPCAGARTSSSDMSSKPDCDGIQEPTPKRLSTGSPGTVDPDDLPWLTRPRLVHASLATQRAIQALTIAQRDHDEITQMYENP